MSSYLMSSSSSAASSPIASKSPGLGMSDLQYYTRTTNLEKLFGEVTSQICELSEILGPRTPENTGVIRMEYGDIARISMSLLSERVERIITAKVCVFSDSILRKKIEWYGKNNFLEDLNGIDGRKTECAWRMCPRFTTIEIMEEIQTFMKSIQCEAEEFEGRMIFMSMFNEIEWRQDDAKCILNSKVAGMPTDSLVVIGHFWDQDSKRRGTEPVLKNQTVNGTEPRHQ